MVTFALVSQGTESLPSTPGGGMLVGPSLAWGKVSSLALGGAARGQQPANTTHNHGGTSLGGNFQSTIVLKAGTIQCDQHRNKVLEAALCRMQVSRMFAHAITCSMLPTWQVHSAALDLQVRPQNATKSALHT